MSETQDLWNRVDGYITGVLAPQDEALEAAIEASARAGLPSIQVTPSQGKLLHLLARLQGARNILEIGTLGGYSTIWLARALAEGGRVVTLEAEPKHAEVAGANIARAGLSGVVEIVTGPALETLPRLEAERRGPFDLTFVDADKPSIPDYLRWALKLSRRGSLIVVDNVVREGSVAKEIPGDASNEGVRRMFRMMADEPRLSATALQTVGAKGYDGLAIALVIADA